MPQGQAALARLRHTLRVAGVIGTAIVLMCWASALNAAAPSEVRSSDDVGGSMIDALPPHDAARARIGAAIFAAQWIAAPNVSDGADGLGPLYNETSCAGCHPSTPWPVAALGQERDAGAPVRSTLRLVGDGAAGGDPVYGRQIQERAVHGFRPEGRVTLSWIEVRQVELAGGRTVGLRRPRIEVEALSQGSIAKGTVLSVRRPPAVIGLGLVAAIAEADILAGADPDDRDGDGIRGRAGYGVDPQTGTRQLARFGWKASAVTLAAQTADAFNLDMGLSSPLGPDAAGDCTAAEQDCRAAPDGRSPAKGGFEVSAEELALIVTFLESQAPPRNGAFGEGQSVVGLEQSSREENARAGRRQFDTLGCSACHRASFQTSPAAAIPHLSRRTVGLYSDLLVHDMGPGLADHTVAGDAGLDDDAHLWRTAPLWGLGQQVALISAGRIDGLLHDGRARTIEEAILWHGGEAERSRTAYEQVSDDDRAALLAFLEGL